MAAGDERILFFLSTLCSADGVWQQSRAGSDFSSVFLISILLGCPCQSLLDISERCELLQILQCPSVKLTAWKLLGSC